MNNISEKLERILPLSSSPGQYIGGEVNSVTKDPQTVDVSFALAFPDTYTIGMSHLGLQVLYAILNNRPDTAAERVFAPWIDMEQLMRDNGVPLFALESRRPVRDFDIVGFSLQYEMCFTTVLNMLDLAGIALLRKDRKLGDPLIVAGGPCAFNPEPMADFIDIFVVGDGEPNIEQLVEGVKRYRGQCSTRAEFVKAVCALDRAFYAPANYEPLYRDGKLVELRPAENAPEKVVRGQAESFAEIPAPIKPVIPFVEAVHDRIVIEIMRGCPNGCKFCQAGRIKRPVRIQPIDEVVRIARETYENTGFDEIALVSLSSSDYPDFGKLLERISTEYTPLGVNISLPSLRVNEQLRELPRYLKRVRKSGLTMAPEVATDELRRSINKNISNDDLFAALEEAYREGWQTVKLYFMIGLPGETEHDIDAIAEIVKKASNLRRTIGKGPAQINAAISTFVPKPFTPLERVGMIDLDYIYKTQRRLRDIVRSRKINLKFHNSKRSAMEGAFSRGDRRLGAVLLKAWQAGCRLDGWDECFNYEKWLDAFAQTGLKPEEYACRERDADEVLPWSRISLSEH